MRRLLQVHARHESYIHTSCREVEPGLATTRTLRDHQVSSGGWICVYAETVKTFPATWLARRFAFLSHGRRGLWIVIPINWSRVASTWNGHGRGSCGLQDHKRRAQIPKPKSDAGVAKGSSNGHLATIETVVVGSNFERGDENVHGVSSYRSQHQ